MSEPNDLKALDDFIESLLQTKPGQAVAANLWKGVTVAKVVPTSVAGQLLRAGANGFDRDPAMPANENGRRALHALKQAIVDFLKTSQRLWTRIEQAAPAGRFAMVAHRANILPKRQGDGAYPRHVILNQAGLRDVLGCSPSDADPLRIEPSMITKIRTTLNDYRREDAKLGDGVEHVVWITPATGTWLELLDLCEEGKCADAIYDQLGLPRDGGDLAAVIEFEADPLHAPEQGRAIAAPTIFEGYGHPFFRQVDDRMKCDGLGLTLHLGELRAKASSVGGAPEAVLPELTPWHPELKAEIVSLLEATPSANPTADDCADHLWTGLDRTTVTATFRKLALSTTA